MGEYKLQKKLNWMIGGLLASSLLLGPIGLLCGGGVIAGKYLRLANSENYESFKKGRETARQKKVKYLENIAGLGNVDYSPKNSADKFFYNYFNSRVERNKTLNGPEKYLDSNSPKKGKFKIDLECPAGNNVIDKLLYKFYKSRSEEQKFWNSLENYLVENKIQGKIKGKKHFLGIIPYNYTLISRA